MTYGAAFWRESEAEEMDKKGFDDSKALTAAKRANLFDLIKATKGVGWIVRSIPATEISLKMFKRSKISLNTISFDCAIELVRKVLDKGVNVTKVYVDTVGDPQRYEDYLTKTFNNRIEFTVRKKADSIYKVVSAASIAAKVTRDVDLEAWVFSEKNVKEDREFGSGYPADPRTKEWMGNNMDPVFGYPDLVRFSWSTVKELLDPEKGAGKGVKWEEEDDDDADVTNNRSMFEFLNPVGGAGGSAGAGSGKKRKRCAYFEQRGMVRVSAF
jgi:ribonuclease H2 subunit A